MSQSVNQEHEKIVLNMENLCQEILSLYSSVLGYDADELSSNDNFFEIGGDSLTANQLINKIQQKYSVVLTFDDLVDNPTIELLTKLIQSNTGFSRSNSLEI